MFQISALSYSRRLLFSIFCVFSAGLLFLYSSSYLFPSMAGPSARGAQNHTATTSAICFAPAPQNYHDVCTTVVFDHSQFLAELSKYDVAVVGIGTSLLGSFATEIETFVNNGGGVVAVAPYAEPGAQPLPPGFEITITDPLWPGAPDVPPPSIELTQAGAAHPILEGVSLEGAFSAISAIGIVPIDTMGSGWTLLAKSDGHANAALAVGNYGAGRLVLTAISALSDANGLKLMGQMVTWAGQSSSSAPTPSPTPSPSPMPSGPDMQVEAIEVTQAIQDLNNSVDLIANKRTFVRVHVSSSEVVTNVVANLEVMRNGAPLSPTLIPGNWGADIIINATIDRGQLNDSFWFEIPTDWVDVGEVLFTATVDPNDTKEDPDLANNQKSTMVEFLEAAPLPLRLYNVQYRVDGKSYRADDFHLDRAESWLRRTYPISKLDVKRVNFVYPEDGLPKSDRLFSWLGIARWLSLILKVDSADTYHFGIVGDGGGVLPAGQAEGIPGHIGIGPTGPTGPSAPELTRWDKDGSYGDYVMGHEIAHLIGRFHADFCGVGANNFTAAYPHRLGRISPTTKGNRAIYGFDIESMKIYDPNWKDFMTYCEYRWVSDYTYEGIRTALAAANAANAPTVEAEKFVIVSGTVTGTADAGNIAVEALDIQLIDRAGSLQLPQPGDWSIVLLDAANQELEAYPFTIHESAVAQDDLDISTLISEAVPWQIGTAKVEIRKGTQAVASKSASANAPTVSITSPTQGQMFGDGPIQFEWSGADSDQDPLTYSVLYRHTAESAWEVLSTNLITPQLAIDASLLPGGSTSYLQILASDGFLTGAETVGPFTVPAGKPSVTIESPLEDGAIFTLGQLVTLQGSAYDLEDGQLTGAALSWASDIDGGLGSGATIHKVDLSTGNHTITFIATDGDGRTAQAQRTISILTGTEAEPDILSVAPTAHSVTVEVGQFAVFSSTFTVRNSGGADLQWLASKDAAWISLDKSSGATPSGMIVTVDATGLGLGRHHGIVTVDAGGALNASVEVPVVVEVVEEIPEVASKDVYLPFVMR